MISEAACGVWCGNGEGGLILIDLDNDANKYAFGASSAEYSEIDFRGVQKIGGAVHINSKTRRTKIGVNKGVHVRDGHTKLSDTANIDKWCTAAHSYKICPYYIIPDWLNFKRQVDGYIRQLGGSSVVSVGTFMVRVIDPALNIRAQPSLNAKINGVIRDNGVYTIVAQRHGNGVLWGKLKNGAGWISLGGKYVKKI